MFEAEVSENEIKKVLEILQKKYDNKNFSFQIYHQGGGYEFMTKPEYQASISILLKHQSKKRLSTSALETLAIIAYKQPVTKPQVEQIRGVNCDYSVQRLLDKGLIKIEGKSHTIGRPLIYGTSEKFIEYFGINSLEELPSPKDFGTEDIIIGEEREN